ncbi:hypothetical protein Acr_22g0006750 [Actinidia rufa]|uniref:Uncharacterized protein n=1 Tax=Actinidia rufa TaxID=165716 RepID=A0A7J0GKD4_9ERIC|nr:hypothetical protein Acr_22g0006750 [Actinidia rufa]
MVKRQDQKISNHVPELPLALIKAFLENLRLRDFTISFIECTYYTWYANITPREILGGHGDAALRQSFLDGGVFNQDLISKGDAETNEGILAYIKHFHHSAMERYELDEKITLVKICMDGMQPNYKLLLVNHHLPNIFQIVGKCMQHCPPIPQPAKLVAELVALQQQANLTASSIGSWEEMVSRFYMKFFKDGRVFDHAVVLHVARLQTTLGESPSTYIFKSLETERNLGDSVRLSFSRSHWRNGRGPFAYVTKESSSRGYKKGESMMIHPPPPLLYKYNEAKATLDKLVEDGEVKLPHVKREPSRKDQQNSRYCIYHRAIRHATKDC